MAVNLVHHNACAKCGDRRTDALYSVDLSELLCLDCLDKFNAWCETQAFELFSEFLR